jgi:hypothetical protein
MNILSSILIVLAALIGIYIQCTFEAFRHIFGAQFDVLPPLAVCAALRSNPPTMAALAIVGGLCFDSQSLNLFGVTILPLFVVSMLIYTRRALILEGQVYAQFVLGAAASAVVPFLTILLLLSARQSPVLGWGSLWQWLVVTFTGAIITPVLFWLFDWLNSALTYRPATQTSFRQDREIARGR